MEDCYKPETSRFCSVAYGLGIQSSLALPELVVEEADVNVHVCLGANHRLDLEDTKTDSARVTADDGYLSWKEVGIFHIRKGNEIVINPALGAAESVLRLFVLGPALALLLHQRGRLVLHASAVSIDGEAVAFLGGQGWGKSTTAGALYARGHAIVADDVVALNTDEASGRMVYPGFPQLKLWPEVAATLGDEPEKLPRLHPLHEKRAYSAARGFSTKPLALRCLYVLAEGAGAQVEDLEPQAAFLELVRHTYTARVLDIHRAPSHFLQCANLAAKVPIRRLKSQRSLAALPGLATLVEKDCAANHR
jgi:hypothetical protein